MTRTRTSKELIRVGDHAAEVEIELHYSDESWSPTMSGGNARKLEMVRLALQRGRRSRARSRKPRARAASGLRLRAL